MSTTRDGEKGPSGEDKGGGKGKGKAQVVGTEEQDGGNNNTSKHADTDEFWSQHSGGERFSNLFGAHGAGGIRPPKPITTNNPTNKPQQPINHNTTPRIQTQNRDKKPKD